MFAELTMLLDIGVWDVFVAIKVDRLTYVQVLFDAPYYQSGDLGDLKAAVFSVITPAVF